MSMLLATGSSDSYAYIYSLKLNQEVINNKILIFLSIIHNIHNIIK